MRIKSAAAAIMLVAMVQYPAVSMAAENYAKEKAGEVSQQKHSEEFWFESEEGTRTFDIESDALVPHLQEGDRLEIEKDVINAYSSKGELVASVKANLPEGVELEYDGNVIRAKDTSTDEGCINNKWVSFGINVAADALVCAPFGAGTGGVGGLACGAAVGAGITALNC